jgi:hypothetical protein
MEYVDLEWETASGWMPVWADLAKANYLTGRYQAALEAAREGRVRFPEDPILVGYEIWALIALGSLDEVEALLDKVGEMEPSWGDSPGTIFVETAGELARHGHGEEARAAAERAVAWYVDRDPESHQLERSRALLAAGKPEEALALLGPLIDQDPESVTPHGLSGVALALTGDRDGAEAEARWCAELDRPYLRGSNTYWRAAILAHLGRNDEATRLRRDAFQEGQSYLADPAPADLNFRPLWGYGPFEQIIAPRG